MSDSLRPHESQHARPPCPSPTPGVHSDTRPSSPVMPSSHLILCRPLLLLLPIPPSIKLFSNESTLLMRWPKYWSFSFSRRRQWHPIPVLLPGQSHGWKSLVGSSPWGRLESDTTEKLHFHFSLLEKDMATHSSVLAWRTSGTGEPGGLLSMGSHRVGHD